MGRADVTDSINVNAQFELSLEVNGRLRLQHRLSALASLAYISLEDQGNGSNEHRKTLKGSLGLEYELRDGMAGRILGRSTTSTAVVNNDFDRLEGVVEVGFAF